MRKRENKRVLNFELKEGEGKSKGSSINYVIADRGGGVSPKDGE